jgi:hypothetical protein
MLDETMAPSDNCETVILLSCTDIDSDTERHHLPVC